MTREDETVYDSFTELLTAVENGEIEPNEITVFIDNDYVQAYIEDPDIENVDDMNTVPPEEDVQWLVYEQKLPRLVLADIINTLGFQSEFA